MVDDAACEARAAAMAAVIVEKLQNHSPPP